MKYMKRVRICSIVDKDNLNTNLRRNTELIALRCRPADSNNYCSLCGNGMPVVSFAHFKTEGIIFY